MARTIQENGHLPSQLLVFHREPPPAKPHLQIPPTEEPDSKSPEDLLSTISQKISAPINIIAGAAWSLKDECGEHDRDFWIDCILRNALSTYEFVEDMQDELHEAQGTFQIHVEEMSLSRVVAEAVEDFGPIARDYELQFYGDTAWILGDPKFIKRLVFNLLSNAIKYSESGREIKVDVWKRGDRVCLFVQDQGEGIKPNENEQMFSSFVPLDAEQIPITEQSPGLRSVKRIADAHGASIKVQGTAGQGTIFEVEFQALDCSKHREN